ncbi:MAG: IS3 family transposase [Myxococcales bacterium]|nr:IS3 family transposase [Myxococcales bacterium]
MSRQTSEGLAPVMLVVALFGLSRAAYYAAKKQLASSGPKLRVVRGTASRFASASDVLAAIRKVVTDHPAWGVRKVWALLRREHGLRVGLKRVYALMRDAGLLLPADGHRLPSPRGTVAVEEPNRLWATDLTTVHTRLDGWVGVTPTVDCGCRSLLGVVVSTHQDAATLLESMKGALEAEFGEAANVPDGLEWRTDHGPQFTGGDARDLCKAWSVEHTFAPIGRPTGNAVAERFIRTLKEEVLWVQDFDTADDVRKAVEAWWPIYNERRPHQALKFETPTEVRTRKLGDPLPLPIAA